MTGKRTWYSAQFKAKVALEPLQGELTAAQLAGKEPAWLHDLDPVAGAGEGQPDLG
jgi:hypothetical protein